MLRSACSGSATWWRVRLVHLFCVTWRAQCPQTLAVNSPSFTVVRTDRGFKRAPMCGQKGSAGVRQIRARGPSQTRRRAIVRAFMQSSCAVRASADGDGWAGVVRSGTSVGGSVGVSVNSPRFHGAPMRSGTPVLSNAAALEVLRTCRCPRMCRCGRLEGRGARTAWVLSGEGHGRCSTCTRSAELVYVRCTALGNNRSRASGAHARVL